MKNKYLEKLNKIEFVVTYACTGRCKHCSEGDHRTFGERIDPRMAADAVRRVSLEYAIETVMAFGGEPLLYTDAVYAIMSAAKESGVPHRQIITNGYFTKNSEKMREVAWGLKSSGVNDLLLSVDAFHQETIPIETVRAFALEVILAGIRLQLQPAWLVSREDDNPYNERTRNILNALSDLGAPVGKGNVVFPEGNARIYLGEYFSDKEPKNPYIEDPCCVKCLSIEPNGDLLGSNILDTDIMEILNGYAPNEYFEGRSNETNSDNRR